MTAPALATPGKRPAPRPRLKAGEPLPAYGTPDSVGSFRAGLRARERATVARALEILGRYMRQPGTLFDGPDKVGPYLQLQLAGEPCECFGVLYLDSQHAAVAFETMFRGTLAQASVYPREVVLAALRHDAAAVILAHNHPSGNLAPSRADTALTQTLKTALALIDVRVLDHFIVSGAGALSMAEKGLV